METENQVLFEGNGSSSTTREHSELVFPTQVSRDSMMNANESRKEVCNQKVFAKPKATRLIGYWNLQTMLQDGKIEQLVRETRKYKINILGISEVRWSGSGKENAGEGMTLYYSGRNDNVGQSGVGLLLDKDTANCVLEWKPVSDRIITIRLNSNHIKTVLYKYMPPKIKIHDIEKDSFYASLQNVIEKTPKHDMLIVMGDLNAKIGLGQAGEEKVVGQHGLQSERTDNGDRFVELCKANNLAITSTMFIHKDIHKYTWTSPDGRTRNQIDHFAVCGKFRGSILDTRTYRGADICSDHNLSISKVKLRLNKTKKINQRPKYDLVKLKFPSFRNQYNIEVKNRFDVLMRNDHLETSETMWSKIKETYNETARKVVGFKKKKHKEWISQHTCNKISERNQLKVKRDSARSERIKIKINKEYRKKDKEIKRSIRKDKRTWVNNIAQNAERGAAEGNMKCVYDATRTLCGDKIRKSDRIKDKDGNILTEETKIRARWKEHFEEVLNRPNPTEILDIPIQNEYNNSIRTDYLSIEEIKKAMKQTKKGKQGGFDGVTEEMLTADIDSSAQVLNKLYEKVWDEEQIPEDWKKGLISKIPKKGSLTECGNWRGITLSSVPAKILGRAIINRIRDSIDIKLRREQAGFRKGRGTNEHIFTLRNIIEQSLEWNTNLHICFVDFEKAFDSVHRDTLWKLMAHYGIPNKIIRIVEKMYENNVCAVLDGNGMTEWFQVLTGVKQGCTMSGFLFLLVVDYIMRQTTDSNSNGIRWTLCEKLDDLDYADDIALLSSKFKHSQDKLEKLNNIAKKTLRLILTKQKL